jgi:hypothetical protein
LGVGVVEGRTRTGFSPPTSTERAFASSCNRPTRFRLTSNVCSVVASYAKTSGRGLRCPGKALSKMLRGERKKTHLQASIERRDILVRQHDGVHQYRSSVWKGVRKRKTARKGHNAPQPPPSPRKIKSESPSLLPVQSRQRLHHELDQLNGQRYSSLHRFKVETK